MTIVFWLFLFLIIYCYFGYPFIIALLAKLFPRKVHKAGFQPFVSIVISVYNEEDVIARKIDNLLALDYPAEKMEIWIGSDGSTDRTNEIILNYKDPRVHLAAYDERSGKMLTVSRLIEQAKGEIIFFNDARQTLASDALKNLVENFSDPKVGCASGELILTDEKGGATAKGINVYWEYEKYIRNAESNVHSMLGATGAIYAIRKELFRPGPANVVLDDMYTPLKIIQQGFRAIFDGSAHAFDKAAQTANEEHRRKARTLYGNYQIFYLFAGLFNPFTSPVAIQFFSHKLLRVLVPFIMIALIPVNALILNEHPVYKFFLFCQICFYGLACLGALSRNQKYGILSRVSKIAYIPYVFCLLNFSALAGFYRFINAKQEITWQKARQQDN